MVLRWRCAGAALRDKRCWRASSFAWRLQVNGFIPSARGLLGMGTGCCLCGVLWVAGGLPHHSPGIGLPHWCWRADLVRSSGYSSEDPHAPAEASSQHAGFFVETACCLIPASMPFACCCCVLCVVVVYDMLRFAAHTQRPFASTVASWHWMSPPQTWTQVGSELLFGVVERRETLATVATGV